MRVELGHDVRAELELAVLLALEVLAYQEPAAFGVELRVDNVPLAPVAGDWGYYLAATASPRPCGQLCNLGQLAGCLP